MNSMAALITEVLGRESGVSGSVHCPPMYTESGRGDCALWYRGSLFTTVVIIHNISYSATLFRVGIRRIEDLVFTD